ncbi:uncharacterized protein BXZ73DRAFT_81033 [Epithele typhae]|uniref:uncharacterized protein n=1 Tax=Epithele typhae TaxID=378194 RepID=UPI00200872BF|nr:uncharacterized protein BXZ73DRAFT_81033 [Epithele typhae]KAH9916584.1 hypothetical protein BXZ73DRAFT_81033 [Epithele typhae]
MSNSETRKRPRLSDDAEDGEAGRVKNDEFWYEDGSITLVAEGVEFRVYKGVLANASPIFKDMFTLPEIPSSPDATNTVVLQDSADDVRRMLRLVLPRDCVHIAGPLEMWDISAGIRLGHKYDIRTLVDHLTKRLGEYYTSSWTAWRSPSREKVPSSFKGTAAIAVINIARLTGANWLLPAAFLECCLLLPRELLAGFKRGDGTMERLSTEDLATCLEATPNLLETHAIAVGRLSAENDACPNECGAPLRELHEEPVHFITHALDHPDITQTMIGFYSAASENLCSECAERLQEMDLKIRQASFMLLPQVFGLAVDGWGSETGKGEQLVDG